MLECRLLQDILFNKINNKINNKIKKYEYNNKKGRINSYFFYYNVSSYLY